MELFTLARERLQMAPVTDKTRAGGGTELNLGLYRQRAGFLQRLQHDRRLHMLHGFVRQEHAVDEFRQRSSGPGVTTFRM